MIIFDSTWNNLPKHWISAEILLMESYVQGALRKELRIAFGQVLLMNFASTWNNLLKYCSSANFLLMEGYVEGALGKELHTDPFVETLKRLHWESLTDKS